MLNRQRCSPLLRFGRLASLAIAALISSGGPAEAQTIEPLKEAGVAVTPNVRLNNQQLASRFLGQATSGATQAEIDSLSAALSKENDAAFADWLRAQYAKPISPADFSLTILRTTYDNKTVATGFGTHAPDAGAIRAGLMISDDANVLRRRVAYALSEIFVVSDQGNMLAGASEGLCDWYDMLFRDAFSDFGTILKDVTYHPVMGEFLSSEGNAKAGYFNPDSRPDENYAREVMQLFTIGLLQLHPDGSLVADAKGQTIPTYSQPEITEVARVFTGLRAPMGLAMKRGNKAKGEPEFVEKESKVRYGAMVTEAKKHDTGAKTFLGVTLPAGQTAEKDIADTLELLCQHPNAGPFFARALIQHMVTSNPSPAYIRRVAEVFRSSKGNMKDVVAAVLLDVEARDPAQALNQTYGKLREPWLRNTQLARAFHAKPAATNPQYPLYGRTLLPQLAQYPLSAPSVFNFFLPNYEPPGPVSHRNADATDTSTLLVAPEFQIVNSNTALLTPNYLMDVIYFDPTVPRRNNRIMTLDFTPQIGLAGDAAALVENVNTLLTGGVMSDRTRGIIMKTVDQLTPTSDPVVLTARVRTAIYLTMLSPDYAIQK